MYFFSDSDNVQCLNRKNEITPTSGNPINQILRNTIYDQPKIHAKDIGTIGNIHKITIK
jgi:hypothetical protein